jgi:hypothetical protein
VVDELRRVFSSPKVNTYASAPGCSSKSNPCEGRCDALRSIKSGLLRVMVVDQEMMKAPVIVLEGPWPGPGAG